MMTKIEHELTVTQAVTLLTHYGFDIADYTIEELIEKWVINYQGIWIRLAVIEALYQGRYKAFSVEQILNCWKKKGSPCYHFTKEFERLICKNIIQSFNYLTPVSDSNNNLDLPQKNQVKDQEEKLIDQDVINESINQKQDREIKPIDQTKVEENSLNSVKIVNDHCASDDLIYYHFATQPIHKFVPPLDSSGFFLRLKELVEQDQPKLSNN